MNEKIITFLQKIDNIAPNLWYIDGIEQARPTTQLSFIIAVIVTSTLCYFLLY